jgi:hypothetical protein
MDGREIKRRGRKGRPLVRLDIVSTGAMDKEDMVCEINYRALYICGVMVFRKRYRMSIDKEGKKSSGFK